LFGKKIPLKFSRRTKASKPKIFFSHKGTKALILKRYQKEKKKVVDTACSLH